MTLPFTPDEFFDVLAAYNERLWPFVLMLWLVTVVRGGDVDSRQTGATVVHSGVVGVPLGVVWVGLPRRILFENQPCCMGVCWALCARGRAVGLVRRCSPSLPVVARSLLPASSLLGADCVCVVVSCDRARGRARVPAVADIWSTVPNDDSDYRIPAGGGSIVATTGRDHSSSLGIHRWVSGVSLWRARRPDAPRGWRRVGGGSDPSKARGERPLGFSVAFAR